MPDTINSAFIGAAFVGTAILVVFACYFAARRMLHPGEEGDRTYDMASTVAVRIAALHGLILALVYAQELGDYKDIQSVLAQESIAVSDVFNDIRRYGGPEVAPVQAGLADYLRIVVGEEWDLLGRREGLSPKAWTEWEAVYGRILDLDPTTPRETFLAGRLRERTAAIAGFRQSREVTAAGGFGGVFWAPALIGLALLAVPFYSFRPTRTHLLLMATFGAYSGVILLFIYAFANPFEPPGKLEPLPFQRLLEGEIGRNLPPGG